MWPAYRIGISETKPRTQKLLIPINLGKLLSVLSVNRYEPDKGQANSSRVTFYQPFVHSPESTFPLSTFSLPSGFKSQLLH